MLDHRQAFLDLIPLGYEHLSLEDLLEMVRQEGTWHRTEQRVMDALVEGPSVVPELVSELRALMVTVVARLYELSCTNCDLKTLAGAKDLGQASCFRSNDFGGHTV